MPRAPNSAKRQQGATSRDATARHDNGLVGPGKRITSKHRSQSLLDGGNGSPRPSSSDSCPKPASENTDNIHHARSVTRARQPQSPSRSGHAHAKSNGTGAPKIRVAANKDHYGDDKTMSASVESHVFSVDHRSSASLSRSLLATDSDASASADSVPSPPAAQRQQTLVCNPEENARRIDVNAAKNANVHRDPGPLEFAFTVLRSCPLYDTIAILIILMQLSPIALSLIYGLFTLLTFVPPVTTSSGLSITDMFEAAIGTPSITVLLCIDCAFLLVWIFLPALLQNFLLDFAQVTIALTLGGGGSSRHGSLNTFLLCTMIVGISRFGQHPSVQGLSRITTLLGGGTWGSGESSGTATTTTSSAAAAAAASSTARRNGTYAWIRNVLAVHIVMQGLVKCVREWYLRREKRDAQPQGLIDPEAGKSLFPGEPTIEATPCAQGPVTDSDNIPTSSNNNNNNNNNVALSGPAPMSAMSLSTKKKRKQSAQVRIRQPLWAALASTKIVMVKEYELSTAARESAGSNATDIHNLGNAPFNTQPGQIWVCYVGSDEICFATSHFPDEDDDDKDDDDDKTSNNTNNNNNGNNQDDAGAGAEAVQETERHSSSWHDRLKPFYVRVNNAIWQPTRISRMEEDDYEEARAPHGSRWTGDIYGLTPMSSYECEFVSTRTNEVIFSTSVRTAQARTRDADPASAAPQITAHRVLARKDPATTLKTSIATQEVKLSEEKSKLKALRKENNRKANQLRKEIDKLASTVQSSGGNDEKWRQKINQHSSQQSQAEQSVRELEAQIKDMETVPEEVLESYRRKQGDWNAEKARFDAARSSFKGFKTNIDQALKQLASDRDALQNKRNKIAARIAKLDDEHARITDANARGLDEAERRRQQRASLEADIDRTEKSFADTIRAIRAYNVEKTQQAAALGTAMAAYFDTAAAAATGAMPYDVATYNTSVTMHDAATYQAMWGASVAAQQQQHQHHHHQHQQQHHHQHHHQHQHQHQHQQHQQPQQQHQQPHHQKHQQQQQQSFNASTAPSMSMWPAAASAAPHSQSILSSPPHPSIGLPHHYSAISSSPQQQQQQHHQYNPQATTGAPPLANKQRRGRSSSMLSDVSGFTQSDHGDEDPTASKNHHSQNNAHTQGFSNGGFCDDILAGTPSRIHRPPPGLYEHFRAYRRRNDPGSGSGSGCGVGGSNSGPESGSSSVRSGASGESGDDPASPV